MQEDAEQVQPPSPDRSTEVACSRCGRRYSRASQERIIARDGPDGTVTLTIMCSCGNYTELRG